MLVTNKPKYILVKMNKDTIYKETINTKIHAQNLDDSENKGRIFKYDREMYENKLMI